VEVLAVAGGSDRALTRYGADADAILVLGPDAPFLLRDGEWSAEAVETRYGFPVAEITARGGVPLSADAAARARRWWQVSIASEIAGAGRAALDLTVRYVKERAQFGRVLGSYQALQ